MYPTKYLLTQSEAPKGLKLSQSDFADQQSPCEKNANPCKLSEDSLDEFTLPDGTRPKEAWVEGLDTPQTDGAPLTLIAMKFASNEEADDWAQTARSLCGMGQGHGALLQDGDIVVLISASTNEANIYKAQVISKLKAKASGLTQLCSR